MKSIKGIRALVYVMRTGESVKTFFSNEGREVILRTPRWEDLDDLLELINSLVEEGAEIVRDEKVSREKEIDVVSGVLARLEKGEVFFLVAEVGRKVVASSDIAMLKGYEKHVGVIGIVVKKGFRNVGIRTEMMKVLVEQARKTGLKVLTLSVFASNERAIHVYEKVGFVRTGRILKKLFKEGEYVDEVIMTKVLE